MSTLTAGSADASQRLFAVIGATGQQGGATARALLAAGARVRALVRGVATLYRRYPTVKRSWTP